jgi:hypothetical protein
LSKRALFVYYTYSQQTGRVVDALAEALSARDFAVTKALLEFTDQRYSDRFTRLPMHRPVLEIAGMLPPQLRRATGQIRIPEAAESGEYDLIAIGGPTWWLTASMPVRSYLGSEAAKKVLSGKAFAGFSVSRRYWRGNVNTIRKLGEAAGGNWLGETHFVFAGNQVKSMLAWLSYMRYGEIRDRSFGLRIPPTNLQPGFEEQAVSFAGLLAERVDTAAAAT